MGLQDGKHHFGSNKYLTIKTRNTNYLTTNGPTGPLRRYKMYNTNEMINLALNMVEFEGLKVRDLLLWLLDMGADLDMADSVIHEVKFELGVQ
tara:strand:- start:15 stop:293 length:279 start_codon:yes stop_codon:yes gene_type:complete